MTEESGGLPREIMREKKNNRKTSRRGQRKAAWTYFCVIAMLLLCACGKKSGTGWQEQYDLGVRYLSEGNYEEAVIAFTAAIEIDPKRPEAFLGRGSAYIGRRGDGGKWREAGKRQWRQFW